MPDMYPAGPFHMAEIQRIAMLTLALQIKQKMTMFIDLGQSGQKCSNLTSARKF